MKMYNVEPLHNLKTTCEQKHQMANALLLMSSNDGGADRLRFNMSRKLRTEEIIFGRDKLKGSCQIYSSAAYLACLIHNHGYSRTDLSR